MEDLKSLVNNIKRHALDADAEIESIKNDASSAESSMYEIRSKVDEIETYLIETDAFTIDQFSDMEIFEECVKRIRKRLE